MSPDIYISEIISIFAMHELIFFKTVGENRTSLTQHNPTITSSDMTNISLTILLTLALFVPIIWKAKPTDNYEAFFNRDYTNVLKGVFSIIVIFVHIPVGYQNVIQDAIGSFAYIGVTGFFMISAYGMQYGLEHNPKYLSTFPINRLTTLLIPNIIINLFAFAAQRIGFGLDLNWDFIFTLNRYVIILLEYCLLFYIVKRLSIKFSLKEYYSDIILIVCVFGSSLFLYLSANASEEKSIPTDWCYERMGLVSGILIYRHFNRLKNWLVTSFSIKFIIFLISSITLGILYLKFKHIWFFGEYLLKITLGVSIIAFCFLSTIKLNLTNPFTRVLGNISYETYLIHGFIANMLIWSCPQFHSGLYICCVFGFTLLLSYWIHKLDNRLITTTKSAFRKALKLN